MLTTLIPDKAFPPGRNEPCFCGNGKRFKHCCGMNSIDRSPPHGIGIKENFLSTTECAELVTNAGLLQGNRFTVRDSAYNLTTTPDPHRVCEMVQLGETQQILDDIVARAFAEQVLPVTGMNIDWYEEPQLLRYTAGGFYQYHVDGYDLAPGVNAWRKSIDRDISILIYLNDDFTGGDLEFKRFSYFLKPRTGMLVWFPSDMRYEHMARPVKNGCRYVIVSWASASGVDKVHAERAYGSILWPSREKKPKPPDIDG